MRGPDIDLLGKVCEEDKFVSFGFCNEDPVGIDKLAIHQ